MGEPPKNPIDYQTPRRPERPRGHGGPSDRSGWIGIGLTIAACLAAFLGSFFVPLGICIPVVIVVYVIAGLKFGIFRE